MKRFLLACGFLVIAMLSSIAFFQIRRNKIYKEYPSILLSDSINEIIESKPTFEGFRYWSASVIIISQSGKKFNVSANINPNFEDGVGINDVTEPGDRIYKKANNDTIYVYKKKPGDVNTYYFIWSEY